MRIEFLPQISGVIGARLSSVLLLVFSDFALYPVTTVNNATLRDCLPTMISRSYAVCCPPCRLLRADGVRLLLGAEFPAPPFYSPGLDASSLSRVPFHRVLERFSFGGWT